MPIRFKFQRDSYKRKKCENGGPIMLKSKIEEGHDRRKPAVPGTNLIFLDRVLPGQE
jgi:hypothetical protein